MILLGWQAIADYLHISIATAKKWEQFEGLPISDYPNGERVSSSGLIDDWLFTRIHSPGAKRLRRIERRNRGDDKSTFGPRDPNYPAYEKSVRKSATGEAGSADHAARQQTEQSRTAEVLPKDVPREQSGDS